jgi:hypothetical protein
VNRGWSSIFRGRFEHLKYVIEKNQMFTKDFIFSVSTWNKRISFPTTLARN